jgi:hypothetical protein
MGEDERRQPHRKLHCGRRHTVPVCASQPALRVRAARAPLLRRPRWAERQARLCARCPDGQSPGSYGRDRVTARASLGPAKRLCPGYAGDNRYIHRTRLSLMGAARPEAARQRLSLSPGQDWSGSVSEWQFTKRPSGRLGRFVQGSVEVRARRADARACRAPARGRRRYKVADLVRAMQTFHARASVS